MPPCVNSAVSPATFQLLVYSVSLRVNLKEIWITFLSIYPSTYISIYLSNYLSLHLSIHLFVCLFISIYLPTPLHLPLFPHYPINPVTKFQIKQLQKHQHFHNLSTSTIHNLKRKFVQAFPLLQQRSKQTSPQETCRRQTGTHLRTRKHINNTIKCYREENREQNAWNFDLLNSWFFSPSFS